MMPMTLWRLPALASVNVPSPSRRLPFLAYLVLITAKWDCYSLFISYHSPPLLHSLIMTPSSPIADADQSSTDESPGPAQLPSLTASQDKKPDADETIIPRCELCKQRKVSTGRAP